MSKISLKNIIDNSLKDPAKKISAGWTPIVQEIKEDTVRESKTSKPRAGLKSLTEISEELSPYKKEEVNELVHPFPNQIQEQEKDRINITVETNTKTKTISEETIKPTQRETLISKTLDYLSQQVKNEDSYQQPVAVTPANFADVAKKVKFLEQWLGKVSITGPGGGAVNLKDLDDVSYASVKDATDGQVLTYISANAKWESAVSPGVLSKRYYGSFFDTTNQLASNVNTGYFLKINTLDSANGFTTDGANIIAQNSGIYNLQFSNQVHYNGGGGSGNIIEIWLTKNGQDLPNTNTRLNITSNNPYSVASWNFIIPLDAGDKTALKWGTNNLNMGFDSNSSNIGPSIPSVIMTIVSI